MQRKNVIKSIRHKNLVEGEQQCVKAYIVCKSKAYKYHVKKMLFDTIIFEPSKIHEPVFFSKEKAFAYAKYVCQGGVVLKVFIPESAIIGQYETLSIKPELIDQSHLQGCYHHFDGQFQYQHIKESNLN